MNLDLFQRLRQHVIDHPLELHMARWKSTQSRVSPCGTTCCLAGRAIELSEDSVERCRQDNRSESNTASTYLGIYPAEGWDLFHVDEWPDDLRLEYERLEGMSMLTGLPGKLRRRMSLRRVAELQAALAVQVLDRFIAKKSGPGQAPCA